MICNICPHACDLHEDQIGLCRARKLQNGKNIPVSWGELTSISIESIEKKPFYHFRPGSKIISTGQENCNFFCAFCQNFQISQNSNNPTKHYEPIELVSLAKEKNVDGIGFSHNEPTLYLEYIKAVAELKEDKFVVVKTNGFMTQSTLDYLVSYVDAWNVDIKGNEEEYKTICKGLLSPVLKTIEFLAKKSHVEISFIVLPSILKNEEFNNSLRNFIESNEIKALHLLLYYPAYKMLEKTYKLEELIKLYDFYKEKVSNVYIPNSIEVKPEHRNTLCSRCNTPIIERTDGIKIHSHFCNQV